MGTHQQCLQQQQQEPQKRLQQQQHWQGKAAANRAAATRQMARPIVRIARAYTLLWRSKSIASATAQNHLPWCYHSRPHCCRKAATTTAHFCLPKLVILRAVCEMTSELCTDVCCGRTGEAEANFRWHLHK